MLNKLEQSGTFCQDEEEIIKDVGAVAFEGLPALRCSSRNRTSVTDTSSICPGGTDTVRHAHRTYLVDSSPHVFRTKVSATLEGLFLALSLHPEVLRKAHSELDEVVGPDRMPDFGDRDSLVYVNAIIKESLRWHAALPFAVPHATVADDEFRGYFIPAGTTLIPNTWYVASC